MEIQEVNIETMRNLSKLDKMIALHQYREWQKRERKEDRRVHKVIESRIYRHKKRVDKKQKDDFIQRVLKNEFY